MNAHLLQSSNIRSVLYASAIVICLASFYLLMIWATTEGTPKIDEQLLLSLRENNGSPIGPQWLEEAARDITALGSITVLVMTTTIAAFALFFADLKRQALILIAAAALALSGSMILKQLIDRTRPNLVAHETRVFTRSFPSAHALNATAIYLTIATLLSGSARRKRVKITALGTGVGLAGVVGISRVYLGVHWPSDVLAGWLGGSVIALASTQLCLAASNQIMIGGNNEYS